MGFIYQGNTNTTTPEKPIHVSFHRQGEGPGFGGGHCQATSGTSSSGGGNDGGKVVTSPKTNMDTQKDGLEKWTPLNYGHFWYLC